MLIYIAFVLVTFTLRPLDLQNLIKTSNNNYKPTEVGETKTASSAKAKKKICKVAISKITCCLCAILCSLQYYNSSG